MQSCKHKTAPISSYFLITAENGVVQTYVSSKSSHLQKKKRLIRNLRKMTQGRVEPGSLKQELHQIICGKTALLVILILLHLFLIVTSMSLASHQIPILYGPPSIIQFLIPLISTSAIHKQSHLICQVLSHIVQVTKIPIIRQKRHTNRSSRSRKKVLSQQTSVRSYCGTTRGQSHSSMNSQIANVFSKMT